MNDDEVNGEAFTDKRTFGLGSLDMAFSLEIHDPRKCHYGKSKAFWSSPDNTFTFNAKDHAREVFQHRIGESPRAALVLGLVGDGSSAAESATIHQFKYNEERRNGQR